MSFKKISVIGLGYIGLPTAAMFASRKVLVHGVDVHEQTVNTINAGKIHIVEPELDILVRATVNDGYLRASTAVEPADAFLLAVPTPFKENHEPDLSYIKAAAEAIAPVLEKGNLVILESTSPVGATEKMCQWMADKRPDLSFPHNNTNNSDIAVAHCPERVLPGHVVRELVENDRIIGGITPSCAEKAQALYDIFVQGTCYITDAKTAEMAKLVENSYRDVNIAFANELSIICNKLNINVWDLITLANKHPRVNILQPGCGVGGHCIAVDPWFIIDSAPKEAKLIKQARLVNESKPEFVVSQVLEHANKFKKPTVACLGLAFKPDIDDLRESPALKIMNKLASIDSIEVLAVEPNINETAKGLAENASLVSMEEAVKRADIIVILVKHKQFKNLEGHLDQKIFLDFVNI